MIPGTFACNYLRQVGLSEIRVKHLTTHEIDVASQLVEIVLVSVRHGDRHCLIFQITKCQNSTSPVCIAYDGSASRVQLLEFRIDSQYLTPDSPLINRRDQFHQGNSQADYRE